MSLPGREGWRRSAVEWKENMLRIIYFILLLALTACGTSSIQPLPTQAPVAVLPGDYRLQWVDQSPVGDDNLARVPVDGRYKVIVKFASIGDPIPANADLGLYLHKDLAASTPGPADRPFDSFFRHNSWDSSSDQPVMFPEKDGFTPAYLIVTARASETEVDGLGKVPVYRFEILLSGRDLSSETCWRHRPDEDELAILSNPDALKEQWSQDLVQFLCREDFGVAIMGQTEWLPAEVGKGGRPNSMGADNIMGYANAWWHIQVCDDEAIPCTAGIPSSPGTLRIPWLEILAFILVVIVWLLMFSLRSSSIINGLWFIIGAILLMRVVGWAAYRTVLNPTHVSIENYDLARRQAVIHTKMEMSEADFLQPYGCTDAIPDTQFPNDPLLTQMSDDLRVAIVLCPSSSWSYGQPGAIFVWRDVYGTHAMFLFGAQWRLYQEQYARLGRPSSLPHTTATSPNYVAINFGGAQRIIYRQDAQGAGRAWIQERAPLFWVFPNIFCIPGLTAEHDRDCWTPATEPAGAATPYAPNGITGITGDDWMAVHVPLGGLLAPLNFWKVLGIGIGLYLAFFLVIGFYRLIVIFYHSCYWGCIARLSAIILFGVTGATIMAMGIMFGFTDFTNPEAMINNSADFLLPDGLMGQLVRLGLDWLETWNSLQSLDPFTALFMMLFMLAIGGFLGFFLMPVWGGMALGGVIGAWVGVIVEIGLIIAGALGMAMPKTK